MMGHADAGVRGPSDKEVVAHLQRLASARAHLLHAEREGTPAAGSRRDQVRKPEIEEAHATLLWAQAQVLTGARSGRSERALHQAEQAERQALRRHGYGSFRTYLEDRTRTPTADIALELALREHAAALAEWEAISQEAGIAEPHRFDVADPNGEDAARRGVEARVLRDEASATVVIDLTGDNPRRIA